MSSCVMHDSRAADRADCPARERPCPCLANLLMSQVGLDACGDDVPEDRVAEPEREDVAHVRLRAPADVTDARAHAVIERDAAVVRTGGARAVVRDGGELGGERNGPLRSPDARVAMKERKRAAAVADLDRNVDAEVSLSEQLACARAQHQPRAQPQRVGPY